MYHVGRPEMLEGKRFFSAHGNAHVKEGLEENQVCRLRPGSVGGSDVDGEVVDDAVHE